MFRRVGEIGLSLVAIVLITVVYLSVFYWAGAVPAGSSFVGHSIGGVGFALMLATEALYSIRKRFTDARWGNMAGWLRFHIVTGLVGPYMVFLHTAFRFNGLAGVLMLLTAVVVVSGVVGRYLYTRVPRDAARESERTVLGTWRSVHVPLTWALFAIALVHVAVTLYYATLQR